MPSMLTSTLQAAAVTDLVAQTEQSLGFPLTAEKPHGERKKSKATSQPQVLSKGTIRHLQLPVSQQKAGKESR